MYYDLLLWYHKSFLPLSALIIELRISLTTVGYENTVENQNKCTFIYYDLLLWYIIHQQRLERNTGHPIRILC